MKNIIYKYFHSSRSEYIKTELVRFTQPYFLNDPFESIPRLDSNGDILSFAKLISNITNIVAHSLLAYFFDDKSNQNIEEDTAATKEVYLSLLKNKKDAFSSLEKVIRDMSKNIGVFSLSSSNNKTIMWSHYANNHQGYVIGFDSNHSFFKENQEKSITALSQINYVHERIKITDDDIDSSIKKILMTKHIDWHYEKEHRMIADLKKADKKIGEKHLFKIPHDAVKEIIIGHKAKETLKRKLYSFAKKNDIKLYLAKPSRKTFDMEIEKIEDLIIS